jgi:hypothetical protein
MAQKARMKIFERMKNGKRRHILTVLGIGRTKALAKANVRRNARKALRRNFSEQTKWGLKSKGRLYGVFFGSYAEAQAKARTLSKEQGTKVRAVKLRN